MQALLIFMVFQCIHVAWFQSCIYTETDYVCREIPKDYPAGLTSMILFVSDLGEISLSMFNSTNLTSVTSLTITQTRVTAIQARAFDKFQNLKTLNMDNNYLSQVSSDWFSHHGALETFRLSNNKITTLDYNSFHGLSNLLTLNMSRNQIHTITLRSFLSQSKLRQLDLSNNNLTHLSVEVLLPLNGTKIHLDGNPWDCSCSVQDFTRFLKGLQNASLLENEMQVCCNSPPELKGTPVWKVPDCKILTTVGLDTGRPATGSPATGSSAIGSPASITTNKPFTIGHSTLIILIVVLCALVLVVCVLSVLYHRKRERKHLQAVKPSPEKTQSVWARKTNGMNNKMGLEENRKVNHLKISNIPDKTQNQKNATTQVLLRTDQTVTGDKRISQIYHIYSSGFYQIGEPIKRVRSAEPVLCRTSELCAKQTETKANAEEADTERNDGYYNGWVTSEKQKEQVGETVKEVCEKTEQHEDEEDEATEGEDEEHDEIHDVLCNATNSHLLHEEEMTEKNEETDESTKTGESVDKEVPHQVERDAASCKEHNTEDTSIKNSEMISGSQGSEGILQGEDSTAQSVECAENIPYLTIGADPENRTSLSDQSTAKGRTKPGPSRPIRRVLTWPPTAVQWKKQWAQNQQILNVFPKLIFVTGCGHEINPLQSSISPAHLQTLPLHNAFEPLPENTSLKEDVRVTIDGETYRGDLESSTREKVLHFSAQESLPVHISPGEDVRIIRNGETWRSGLESTFLSDFQEVSSWNSPIDDSEVSSELFSVFHQSASERKSKPAVGEKIDNKEKVESMKKRRQQAQISGQIALELQKQSRRAEKAAHRGHEDGQQGQVYSSDSRAPPSGGSPKDDSLLLGNEYTYIDLLHEVVENHGRWTRERWRKTQINKHKLKQQGQSH